MEILLKLYDYHITRPQPSLPFSDMKLRILDSDGSESPVKET